MFETKQISYFGCGQKFSKQKSSEKSCRSSEKNFSSVQLGSESERSPKRPQLYIHIYLSDSVLLHFGM